MYHAGLYFTGLFGVWLNIPLASDTKPIVSVHLVGVYILKMGLA